jgi:plasmid stabilization system protein ParE
MRIIFRDDARAEFDDALAYYNERDPAVAAGFVLDYQKLETQLLQFPNVGALVARNGRRLIFSKYPYQLVYRVEGEEIVIYAVAHQKRRPGYWRKRVAGKG